MANEVRLIDLNTLWECETCFHNGPCGCNTWCDAGEGYRPAASKFKIIDPESLRPKGRWTENRRVGFSDAIEGDVYWFTYTCSECGGEVMNDYHYCPNCGADMRGEVDDK